jgi:hypothetical protein
MEVYIIIKSFSNHLEGEARRGLNLSISLYNNSRYKFNTIMSKAFKNDKILQSKTYERR